MKCRDGYGQATYHLCSEPKVFREQENRAARQDCEAQLARWIRERARLAVPVLLGLLLGVGTMAEAQAAAFSTSPLCPRCVVSRAPDGALVLLPDPALTPGEVDPTLTREQACKPERQRKAGQNARKVSRALRQTVVTAYGVTAPSRQWRTLFELDHRIPVKLEGRSTAKNLWVQPYPQARQKDALENEIIRLVCRVKKTRTTAPMSLKDGQEIFRGDWYAAYLRYVKHEKETP